MSDKCPRKSGEKRPREMEAQQGSALEGFGPKKSKISLSIIPFHHSNTNHATPEAPKNVYGTAKIEAKEARRREHEEDWIEHDRATKAARAKYRLYAERKQRLEKISSDAEKRKEEIRLELLALDQKQVQMAVALEELEEKFGEDAVRGEKDARISEKYRAFLEMETDELDLETLSSAVLGETAR